MIWDLAGLKHKKDYSWSSNFGNVANCPKFLFNSACHIYELAHQGKCMKLTWRSMSYVSALLSYKPINDSAGDRTYIPVLSKLQTPFLYLTTNIWRYRDPPLVCVRTCHLVHSLSDQRATLINAHANVSVRTTNKAIEIEKYHFLGETQWYWRHLIRWSSSL